jgi:hypothetical protein
VEEPWVTLTGHGRSWEFEGSLSSQLKVNLGSGRWIPGDRRMNLGCWLLPCWGQARDGVVTAQEPCERRWWPVDFWVLP